MLNEYRTHSLGYWKVYYRAAAFAACTIALLVGGGAPFHSN